MLAVFRHELSGFFHSLSAYVFGAFLLVFVGVGAMFYNIQAAVANFEYVLSFVSIVLVIIVPLLTMRVIAEERRQKTDQLLYSLPISTTEIVMGKFLALNVIFLIPMVLVSFYPIIFSQFGQVYLLTSYGALIAFYFMGSALMAVGMFLSSITENQGFAAGMGVAVILFNYYSVSLAEYVSSSALSSSIALCVIFLLLGGVIYHITRNENLAYAMTLIPMALTCITAFFYTEKMEGLLPGIFEKLSLFSRFDSFVNGVFDLSGIVFFLSVMVFFLFLTVQSLEKRRYN